MTEIAHARPERFFADRFNVTPSLIDRLYRGVEGGWRVEPTVDESPSMSPATAWKGRELLTRAVTSRGPLSRLCSD